MTRALERQVVEEIERRRSELVELLAVLVGFDTRAPDAELTPREHAALQAYVGDRLRAAGLTVELWEPDAAALPPTQYPIPDGYHFHGRPQLVARRSGTGAGRSLLLNGHIDVVPAEPRELWASDPFRADVRDGRLYGRGACDMKGGVAAMVFATEVLSALDVSLRGDLIVNTVTDEESTGAGALASVAHGVAADGGIVPEPTSLAGARGSRRHSPRALDRGRPGERPREDATRAGRPAGPA
jgi:acetylornithine deacetylase